MLILCSSTSLTLQAVPIYILILLVVQLDVSAVFQYKYPIKKTRKTRSFMDGTRFYEDDVKPCKEKTSGWGSCIGSLVPGSL